MSDQDSQQEIGKIANGNNKPLDLPGQCGNSGDLEICVSEDACPSPHSFGNKMGRIFWGLVRLLLFRPSPRVFHFWRRFLLRVFGAKIGANVKIDPSVQIWVPWNLEMSEESTLGHHVDCYNVARVVIGRHATVSQYAFLCTATHDPCDPFMKLLSVPIVLEDQSWVCAGAFVAPGVTIGTGALVGARAVVMRSVQPWDIVAGNPARVIKRRVLKSR